MQKVGCVLPVLKQIKENIQLSAKLSRINSKHYVILEEKVMRPKWSGKASQKMVGLDGRPSLHNNAMKIFSSGLQFEMR